MGFLITTVFFCFFDVGVCGREQDFKQLNVAMKARWSDDCDAWWPCTRMCLCSPTSFGVAQLQLFCACVVPECVKCLLSF